MTSSEQGPQAAEPPAEVELPVAALRVIVETMGLPTAGAEDASPEGSGASWCTLVTPRYHQGQTLLLGGR